MNNPLTKVFEVNGKKLCLVALNNGKDDYNFDTLTEIVEDEFTHLSSFIKKPAQILYIRDNKALSIDGKYPGGHTYFPTEAMIAVPSWNGLARQELIAVAAHELHHMARWQNVGYGATLGGAITSEGAATYYEELRSGRKPKWADVDVTPAALIEARKEWDSASYDHAKWFFDGPHGKWVGYSLGYQLIKQTMTDFDLEASITIRPEELRKNLK